MFRILILILVMLLSFVLFAMNYSALDGGNQIPAAIGFWGFFLSPVVFAIIVLVDVIRTILKRRG